MISCCRPTGSKALDYSNGMFDCQSPTSPFMGSLRALHLLEELRSVLEVMDTEERESLRCQIPESTVDSLGEWINGHLVRSEDTCHGASELNASIFLAWKKEFCVCFVNTHIFNLCVAVMVLTASVLWEPCWLSWEPERCFSKPDGILAR